MRRECRKRLSALLTALLLFTLSACGTRQPAGEASPEPLQEQAENASALEGYSRAEDYGRDPLYLSNYLFPDSALTEEQKTLIDSVQQIADAAVFDPDERTLELVNTCPFSITGSVYTLFYESDALICSEATDQLIDWEPGMHRQLRYDPYYFQEGRVNKIAFSIEFCDDTHWYRTAIREIPYRSVSGGVEIVNPYTLPRTFRIESGDETAIRVDALEAYSREGYTIVAMDLTVVQASRNYNYEITVRLLDGDGAVVDNEHCIYYELKAKEKVHAQFCFSHLEPGTYTLDIREF